MSLNLTDLATILEELKPVITKWRYIGLSLGMQDTELDVIDVDGKDVLDKFRIMLRRWLGGKDCSWDALCKALCSTLVNNVKLAETLRQKYLQERSSDTEMNAAPTTVVKPTPSTASSPLIPSLGEIAQNTHEEHAKERHDTTQSIHNKEDSSTNFLTLTQTPTIDSGELRLKGDIKLRGYQEELAGPGLQGGNCIVVAPTGTGKTLVASYIIMTHLNKMAKEGKKPKVAFVTPTQQLTFQQNQALQDYIPGLKSVEITGASKAPMSPLVDGDKVDVIVCTAGKLRREMKKENVFITSFSQIVFDECHHAGRLSHYSDVMEFYIQQKLSQPSVPLPQVIGLTASPGAGKGSSTEEQIKEHLSSFCAVLDASSGFVKVKKCIHELERIHNDPITYLEVKDARPPDDPFFTYTYEAMQKLEQIIDRNPPFVKGSSKYQGWLAGEKKAAEGTDEDQRERISVLEQLEVYHQAIVTYNDFQYGDAIAVINEISDFKNPTKFDLSLSKIHSELMKKLERVPDQPNPLQVHMENILKDRFALCPQSRGIFFVRSVKHTEYVTKWIKTSPSLSGLIRATSITGHSRGGMEKSEQIRVLEGFRSGIYNLLASTSVLEEGLDVAECNFVIRYQNISNEIAQVQAKGRARAPDSRMYTVVASNSNKRYQYLVVEEKHQLVISSLDDVPLDLARHQKLFLEKRDRRAQKILFQGRWQDAERVKILCKKCNALVCRGSEVFYCLTSDDWAQYAVPGQSFSTKYEKTIHTHPETLTDFTKPFRIFCRQEGCRQKWGVISHWADTGYEFPLLKCDNFLFKYDNETQRFKQWSKVWFEVQNIRDLDQYENDVKQD